MKYRTLKTFALVGFLSMLAAASVHAQTRNTIEANIPFDFAVGDAQLKAGQYIVRAFALAPRNIERPSNHASEKLVFHLYGDMYFLSEAWINGSGNGLYPSKAERGVGRELAKTNGKPGTIQILARK